MDIGQALKRRREARGDTLEEVAYRADTDASNLSRIERGMQQPSVLLLQNLARALNTTVSEIYRELESGRPGDPADPLFSDMAKMQRYFRQLSSEDRTVVLEMTQILRRRYRQAHKAGL
ncbi:helix-turn-helix domain-containing protein [Isoalcanivorax beigongshangi]|uniref:Helix-turn-helix domain-containing protein n=1 Tax=Isoalcanivorax beigongshangi TaxID=3238810 RepID=A0ABV4AGX1_9GAMM